ncbi:MAG: hypothetical protein B7X50_00385 [Alishewanella sp. 34-51-39]|nr:MAG: hypothetical protein B7X50_00385 [Alishewanella sp. 34-51-39]
MVPSGWALQDFNSLKIATIDGDRGKDYPKKEDYLQIGHALFLGADNIDNGTLSLNKTTFISKEKHESMRKGIVQEKDILLVMRGNGTGRSCIYENKDKSYAARINSGLVIIRAESEHTDVQFLQQLIVSPVIQKQFESFMFGSAQPQLTIQLLKSLRFPFPPLPEQKTIAKILSIWDKAITTTEKLLANSQQQKKALMQQLLTGKKRLLDKNGERFGGEWCERLLGDVSKITTGSSNRQDSHMTGAYTFFDRSEDIRTSDTYLFDCEAVIVPGEGQDFIPKYFVGKFDLHQRTYAIMDFAGCHGKFLFYAIHYFRSHFLSQAVGSTVKSLRLPMFQKMKLSLPTREEQQKIAAVLSTADQEITALRQMLDALKQEKKALMQQLLTGKRRVQLNEQNSKVLTYGN